MRIKLIVLIPLLVNFFAKGQQIQMNQQSNLVCQYYFAWKFDTLTNIVRDDLIILQIGKGLSKSYSYYTFQADSLQQSTNGKEVWKKLLKKAIRESNGQVPSGFPYRRSKTFVYKDKLKEEITVVDGISLQDYIYKDELNGQNWEVLDSTKTILGNLCQLAKCTFRGRTWTAWFAPEIPFSDGPWKFSGLPGLILEVYDQGKQYHFTVKGLEKKEEPIVFSRSVSGSGKFEKTDRIEFLRTQKRYLMNTNGYIEMETGIDLGGNSSTKVMRYDLIERDY